ncbi:hypothetical protein AHAS_Ahas08G0029300 [Arachis hypogaea]
MNIKTLSESLCNLSNLQTLKLYHCSNLTTLPSGLHNLDIRETALEEIERVAHFKFLCCRQAGVRGTP